MALHRATCDKCNITNDFCDLPRNYVFPNGQEIGIQRCYAFCNNCQKAGQAERIPSLEEINKSIHFINNPTEEYIENIKTLLCLDSNEEVKKEIQREQKNEMLRLEWRKKRNSKGKCLTCQSTDIEYFNPSDFDDDPTTLMHSDCGGTITLEVVGFARPAVWLKYDLEGYPIQ